MDDKNLKITEKNKKYRNFEKKINVMKIVEYISVAMASCSIVLVGALLFNAPKEAENGQGGFETPGMPIITEEPVSPVETALSETSEEIPYDLTYFSYRVKEGDMIGRIAEQFNITQDTIISVNNIRSSRLLQIGTYLKIPALPGILYTVRQNGENLETIAKKYSVDVEKCCAVNKLESTVSLSAGEMIFVPDAELDWTTRQEINGDLFKKPIKARWYMSSKFGWRASPFTGARSYHSGVDMACAQGTSIYAAMEGRVTAAGYNNVYGNYVIISHHSGYKTLYGHMKEILVVQNQYVTQDTRIGRVGSTGMSTGPHLHFTVFKNGKQVNPVNLWG